MIILKLKFFPNQAHQGRFVTKFVVLTEHSIVNFPSGVGDTAGATATPREQLRHRGSNCDTAEATATPREQLRTAGATMIALEQLRHRGSNYDTAGATATPREQGY